MNRFASVFLIGLAIVIAFFTVQFFNAYFIPVHQSKTNIITKISFWSVIVVTTLLSISFILFREWIFKNKKKLTVSLIIFCIGIMGIEVFLGATESKTIRFAPHPYINYIGKPYYKSADELNMHNGQGFRGPDIEIPKPKGRIRIAILGGSTVYEDYVKDWKKDFARQLENELHKAYSDKDIEVINAGLPGWNSWNDLINLQFRLIDLEPNLIIVYEGVNDVHARMVKPSAYKSDDTGNVIQWGKDACLHVLCFSIVSRIVQYDPPKFDISAPTHPIPHPESTTYNSILGMTRMEALAKNPPVYFERNLRAIIAVARENNIHVMLSTWAWSNQLQDYASTDHFQKGFREINEVVKKIALAKHVSIYDFANQMPMDKKYWTDGPHNNEEGINLKAKLFATYIVDNKIIDSIENQKNN